MLYLARYKQVAILISAESVDHAILKFKEGINKEFWERMKKHESFSVREATIAHLETLCDGTQEGMLKLEDDCGF